MKQLKKSVSITIDEDVLEKAREMAEERDRSLSQFINLVLKGYINNKNNHNEEWFENHLSKNG